MASQSMGDFVATHRGLVIGGGILGVLVVAGLLFKQKSLPSTTSGPTAGSNLGGLTNGLVYVPTQTTFSTYNQSIGPYSNDPLLQTVTGSPAGNTTTTTTTTTNKYPPPATEPKPIRQPPPPGPNPPPTGGRGLIWDTKRTIMGGETLSSIAAGQTRYLRSKGMPGSMSVTWHDLYAHNTGVINSTAAAHHNPIPGGPWNDIFPGEVITVPRWG